MTYKPEGFSSITPIIVVEDAQKLLDFVKRAFDAEEMHVVRDKEGRIQHAQIKIDGGIFMLADTMERSPVLATLYLYVPDCDAFYERGLASGATSIREPADQFYGDRNGGITDPCGNTWWIATHKEALSREAIEERARLAG